MWFVLIFTNDFIRYAFAIMAWEILARKKPFSDIKKETVLCSKVHLGHRPPKSQLPTNLPPPIVTMIEDCWSKDRSKRYSAVECHSTIDYHFHLMSEEKFDIFFSHAWVNKPLLSHVYRMLTKAGYKVWYDMNDMGHDLNESMKQGIQNSAVVVACVNTVYQSRPACMFELAEARSIEGKQIVSVVLEENPFVWASPELEELCRLRRTMWVDISAIAKDPVWVSESGPERKLLQQLQTSLTPLFKLLRDLKCFPSYVPSVEANASSEGCYQIIAVKFVPYWSLVVEFDVEDMGLYCSNTGTALASSLGNSTSKETFLDTTLASDNNMSLNSG
jgi:hypothetical protein